MKKFGEILGNAASWILFAVLMFFIVAAITASTIVAMLVIKWLWAALVV
jgi:hypothetical protein